MIEVTITLPLDWGRHHSGLYQTVITACQRPLTRLIAKNILWVGCLDKRVIFCVTHCSPRCHQDEWRGVEKTEARGVWFVACCRGEGQMWREWKRSKTGCMIWIKELFFKKLNCLKFQYVDYTISQQQICKNVNYFISNFVIEVIYANWICSIEECS